MSGCQWFSRSFGLHPSSTGMETWLNDLEENKGEVVLVVQTVVKDCTILLARVCLYERACTSLTHPTEEEIELIRRLRGEGRV